MKGYIYTSTPPIGRTACRELQCLCKGALDLFKRMGGRGFGSPDSGLGQVDGLM